MLVYYKLVFDRSPSVIFLFLFLMSFLIVFFSTHNMLFVLYFYSLAISLSSVDIFIKIPHPFS